MTIKERLFKYLKPMRKSLVIAIVFSLLFVIAQIGQPFLLGNALDAAKELEEKYDVEMPIVNAVYSVVREGKKPKDFEEDIWMAP